MNSPQRASCWALPSQEEQLLTGTMKDLHTYPPYIHIYCHTCLGIRTQQQKAHDKLEDINKLWGVICTCGAWASERWITVWSPERFFFFFCERLLNLFFWAFERDTIQQDAMGSANKVFPPPSSLLYRIALLAFTYQEELSSPTRLPCQQESVSLRQVVLAGSTFESKKSGCLERQSCQPHFPQTAVTQAVTSQGCVLTNTFRRGPEQMGIVAVVNPDTVDYRIMSVLCVET